MKSFPSYLFEQLYARTTSGSTSDNREGGDHLGTLKTHLPNLNDLWLGFSFQLILMKHIQGNNVNRYDLYEKECKSEMIIK